MSRLVRLYVGSLSSELSFSNQDNACIKVDDISYLSVPFEFRRIRLMESAVLINRPLSEKSASQGQLYGAPSGANKASTVHV